MLSKTQTYAIIGASNNPEKYGYKVAKDLIDADYNIIPINPKETEILGQKAYPSLENYYQNGNKPVDIAIVIVPPKIGYEILPEIKKLGIETVRFQPGAESEENTKYCTDNNINFVQNSCIMIQRKQQK